jgi:CRP-like cAMP-binding protein
VVNNCGLDVSKAIARFRNSSVPEDILVDLVNDSLVVRYEKDARLFLRGSPADNVMLVITGAVKIYCLQTSGRNVLMGLAGPGEAIGFADFVDAKGGVCATFEARALTNPLSSSRCFMAASHNYPSTLCNHRIPL